MKRIPQNSSVFSDKTADSSSRVFGCNHTFHPMVGGNHTFHPMVFTKLEMLDEFMFTEETQEFYCIFSYSFDKHLNEYKGFYPFILECLYSSEEFRLI